MVAVLSSARSPVARRWPASAGARVFVTAFVLTYGLALMLTTGRMHRHYTLWQSGQAVTATVYNVTWHGKYTDCNFRFSAGGVEVRGYSGTCDNLIDGQQVTVHYLPTDPTQASIRSGLHELLWDIFGPLLLALAGAEFCAIYGLRMWRALRS